MIQCSQALVILTSPPASGKTYWISALEESHISDEILVISPLRALADECRRKWGERIRVMTPEEWLGNKVFCDLVIVDEFHLFFYWGDTFRPLMWEAFFELSERASLTFLLTATLSSSMRQEVLFFSAQFDQILWVDQGNQVLKYKPTTYLKAPSRAWLLDQLVSEERGSVKPVFCRYRSEVTELEAFLVNLGYACVSCVGGEAKHMAEKLAETPTPDFIVSTTVLSHGVNLPSIQKIFFLYEVGNLDFWIQMVARGGRRGEAYQVYSLEKPAGLDWGLWKNLARVLWLTIKRQFSLTYQLNQWTRGKV